MDARRVEPLLHGLRPLEGWSVVLHLDGGVVVLGDLEEDAESSGLGGRGRGGARCA